MCFMSYRCIKLHNIIRSSFIFCFCKFTNNKIQSISTFMLFIIINNYNSSEANLFMISHIILTIKTKQIKKELNCMSSEVIHFFKL